MATTSSRTTIIQYDGDVTATIQKDDAPNQVSPGLITRVNVGVGAYTVTVPTGAVAVTIVPQFSPNEVGPITLKGVTGDTGLLLNTDNPMTLSLDPAQTTFVLSTFVGDGVILLFWT